jgi:arylsulfatase A-like enzyme
MVAASVQKLEDHKILDNTYILYTSDNGFTLAIIVSTPASDVVTKPTSTFPLDPWPRSSKERDDQHHQ